MKSSIHIALAGLLLSGSLSAAPISLPNPDFSKGESIPEGAGEMKRLTTSSALMPTTKPSTGSTSAMSSSTKTAT
jgi:hypothetical protein